MSQIVKVDRRIEFAVDAAQDANVYGDMLPKRMTSIDWFDQKALNTTNDYTVTVDGTSDAVALSAGGINGVTITTGSTDNEISFLGTALIFDASNNPSIEARVTIADVSGTSFFFGFSDANTETTPASTIDYADGTLAAAATDAAGFVVDADKSSSAVYVASIATGGTVKGALASPSVVWADGETKSLRVSLDSSLGARYFIDGVQVGYQALAVTDVPFCAIFNAGTRANDGSNTVIVKYLAKWQDV